MNQHAPIAAIMSLVAGGDTIASEGSNDCFLADDAVFLINIVTIGYSSTAAWLSPDPPFHL